MNHDISYVRVTPHFSNSIEKIFGKDKYQQKLLIEKSKYWHNQLRKAF